VKAQDRFFDALDGVTDPEVKRKIIGELFIRESKTVARELGKGGDGPRFLVQGRCIPTSSNRARDTPRTSRATQTSAAYPRTSPSTSSSHCGTSSRTRSATSAKSSVCPPRSSGVSRSPPGTGRAHRGRGDPRTRRDPSQRRLRRGRRDQEAGLYHELWQSFAVLPAVRTVGVMGDAEPTRTRSSSAPSRVTTP